MRGQGQGPGQEKLILLSAEFAGAAIATAVAFIAAVVVAHVLGAVDANLARRLAADATCKGGSLSHSLQFSFLRTGGAAGLGAGACLPSMPRQRCASLSAI